MMDRLQKGQMSTCSRMTRICWRTALTGDWAGDRNDQHLQRHSQPDDGLPSPSIISNNLNVVMKFLAFDHDHPGIAHSGRQHLRDERETCRLPRIPRLLARVELRVVVSLLVVMIFWRRIGCRAPQKRSPSTRRGLLARARKAGLSCPSRVRRPSVARNAANGAALGP